MLLCPKQQRANNPALGKVANATNFPASPPSLNAKSQLPGLQPLFPMEFSHAYWWNFRIRANRFFGWRLLPNTATTRG